MPVDEEPARQRRDPESAARPAATEATATTNAKYAGRYSYDGQSELNTDGCSTPKRASTAAATARRGPTCSAVADGHQDAANRALSAYSAMSCPFHAVATTWSTS